MVVGVYLVAREQRSAVDEMWCAIVSPRQRSVDMVEV